MKEKSNSLIEQIPLKQFETQMKNNGWFLFENVVDQSLVSELIVDLEQSYEIRRPIQIMNGVDANTEGTAHHLLADGKSFLELLRRAYLDEDRAVGTSGSIVFWDSNIWHAAGENKTNLPRRSLSLIYSQPFMKQQFDYPRSVGYENADSFPEQFKQIVGFNARTPATLDEWYQVPEKRFYKKDQG